MFECMSCGDVYDWPQEECDFCGSGHILAQCPQCEVGREEIDYFPEYDTVCHDCVVLQPKMEELGVGKDDISMETIYEDVRRRNAMLDKNQPISEIELVEGKLRGIIQNDWCEPVEYQQHLLCWQVVD